MPPITPVSLGVPVSSARLWAEGVVPRVGGGWNWIGQLYNYPQQNPTEWVVMHLETAEYEIFTDSLWEPNDRGRYVASSNFHALNRGLRAASARVFWPAVSCYWWWYDPTTNEVNQMDRVSGSAPDASIYSFIFNHDGSKIYGGSQTANNSPDKMPCVMQFDPTLSPPTATFMCRVGSTGRTQSANYAYNLWVDGNYLYVLVGQEFWDVVAVNLSTFTQTILRTTGANSWAYFEEIAGQGLTVRLATNGVNTEWFWVNNGAVAGAYTPGNPPPFAPHDVSKYDNPVVGAPQIDSTPVPTGVGWRTSSSDPYTLDEFAIAFAGPVELESITVLPAGQVFGASIQYQGFFRYDLASAALLYYGEWNQIAEVAFCPTALSGKIYFTGYPNGVLYEYNPSSAWLVTGPGSSQNPKKLGNYSNGVTFSGVKRGRVLAYSSTYNRMYMVGERDRSGDGAGIGWYDFVAKNFGGTFTGLEAFDGHLGLVVFDALDRYVMGGKWTGVGDAPLVLYNHSLVEVDRQYPIAGLTETGKLFRTNEAQIVVGVSINDGRIYRWNIVTETLGTVVNTNSLGTIRSMIQKDVTTLTVIIGSDLYEVDLLTLGMTLLGTLPDPTFSSIAAGLSDELYGTLDTELFLIEGDAPVDFTLDGSPIGMLWTPGSATFSQGTANELDGSPFAAEIDIRPATFTISYVLDASPFEMVFEIHDASVHRSFQRPIIIDLPEVIIREYGPLHDIDLPPAVDVFEGPSDTSEVEVRDGDPEVAFELDASGEPQGIAVAIDLPPAVVVFQSPIVTEDPSPPPASPEIGLQAAGAPQGPVTAVDPPTVAVRPRTADSAITETQVFTRRTFVPTD